MASNYFKIKRTSLPVDVRRLMVRFRVVSSLMFFFEGGGGGGKVGGGGSGICFCHFILSKLVAAPEQTVNISPLHFG